MRFDVLIFDMGTGLVKSVADLARTEDEARTMTSSLNAGKLKDFLLADWFESGCVKPGDVIPVDEERLNRLILGAPPKIVQASPEKKRRALQTYRDRRAAGVCVWCESPDLETATKCHRCAQLNRQRVAKSRADTL